VDVIPLRDIGLQEIGGATRSADDIERRCAAAAGTLRQIRQQHISALGREPDRNRPPDAGGSASDDSRVVLQPCHWMGLHQAFGNNEIFFAAPDHYLFGLAHARHVFRHADVPDRIRLALPADLGNTRPVDARKIRAILSHFN